MLSKVGTETSDFIHDYILDIEHGAMKYVLYQNHCELYKKDEEVTRLKALTDVPTLDAYRKNALTINKQKRTVYVFTSKRYASLDLYKIGISFFPKKRKNGINTTHVLPDDEFYEVHIVECFDADLVEKYIHDSLDQYRYRKEREFFLLPLPLIKKVVDSVASLFNDCYEQINDAIETWDNPKQTAEKGTQHLLQVPPLQQETASIPIKIETPHIQQTVTHIKKERSNEMELIRMFNENIDNEGISEKKLRYLSTLLIITDKVKRYAELQDITSIDTRYLEQYTLPKLRRLAHCMGITQPHTVPSKEQLIQRIVSIYEALKNKDAYEV